MYTEYIHPLHYTYTHAHIYTQCHTTRPLCLMYSSSLFVCIEAYHRCLYVNTRQYTLGALYEEIYRHTHTYTGHRQNSPSPLFLSPLFLIIYVYVEVWLMYVDGKIYTHNAILRGTHTHTHIRKTYTLPPFPSLICF